MGDYLVTFGAPQLWSFSFSPLWWRDILEILWIQCWLNKEVYCVNIAIFLLFHCNRTLSMSNDAITHLRFILLKSISGRSYRLCQRRWPSLFGIWVCSKWFAQWSPSWPINKRYYECSSCTYTLWCMDTAWIRQGHAIDATGTRILHIKSEVSDTIWHDTLSILKYPCIMAYTYIPPYLLF